MMISYWVCVPRQAQSTQNNEFSISLQYFKKEVSNEVDFLHADKHESFQQIDAMILMGMIKHSQSSQNSKFAISSQYLKNNLEMKLIFCMQINIRVSYKLILTLWVSKFLTRSYYYYLWVWGSILKVLEVTSLQCLYNFSKKKLGMEFIFFKQINIKVGTIIFVGSGTTCPKYPK